MRVYLGSSSELCFPRLGTLARSVRALLKMHGLTDAHLRDSAWSWAVIDRSYRKEGDPFRVIGVSAPQETPVGQMLSRLRKGTMLYLPDPETSDQVHPVLAFARTRDPSPGKKDIFLQLAQPAILTAERRSRVPRPMEAAPPSREDISGLLKVQVERRVGRPLEVDIRLPDGGGTLSTRILRDANGQSQKVRLLDGWLHAHGTPEDLVVLQEAGLGARPEDGYGFTLPRPDDGIEP